MADEKVPSAANSSADTKPDKYEDIRLMNKDVKDRWNNLRSELDTNDDGVLDDEERNIDTEPDSDEFKALEEVETAFEARVEKLLDSVNTDITNNLEALSEYSDFEELEKFIDEIENDILKELSESLEGDNASKEEKAKIKLITEYIETKEELSDLGEKTKETIKTSKSELVKLLKDEDSKEMSEDNEKALHLHGHKILVDNEAVENNTVIDLDEKDSTEALFKELEADDLIIAKAYIAFLSKEKEGKHILVDEDSELIFVTENEFKENYAKPEKEKTETPAKTPIDTENAARENEDPKALEWAKGMKLKGAAKNRAAFQKTVADKTKGKNASIFGRLLNFLFGPLIGPLSESNSVLGRIFRKVADIPDPTKELSPIPEELAETALSESKITPILSRLNAIKPPTTTKINKSSNLTNVLKDGLGVDKGNIESSKKKLKKTTQHSIKITPTGKDQFAQIYSFFKSDPGTVASQKVLQSKMDGASQFLPAGIGGEVMGGLQKVTDKLMPSGVNVEGGANGLLDMFAPEAENLDSGNLEFAKAKQQMDSTGNLFVGLGVEATSTGHIIITWSDDNEKAKPKTKSKPAAANKAPATVGAKAKQPKPTAPT